MRFSVPPETWSTVRERYDLQLRVALHVTGWAKDLAFSPATMRLIAATGAELGFDLYFYGDEQTDVPARVSQVFQACRV